LADVMPTVLGILKLQVPRQVQGQSLLSLLRGKTQEEPRSLYSESFLPRLHFNWSELRGLQTANYHFIDAPKPELYDLSKDPGETRNLFPQKRAVAEEIRVKLARLIREYSAGQELAEKTALDPALMERLKSLGYAGFSGGGNPTISNRELPDPKDRIQTYELISDAIADSQHGRYRESSAQLETALKAEPNSVPIHYLQGLNDYRLKEFPKAVEEFERVLQLSPDYSLAAYHLGLAYARNGQMDEAIVTLRHTLELDPTNFDAAYNLGAAYLYEQRVSEAEAAFRQSLSIAGDHAPSHLALGQVLLYQGQIDDAIRHLRRAAELSPGNPGAHAELAKALAAKGLAGEAEEEMRKAQQSAPQ
jgi:choline-sulfatase